MGEINKRQIAINNGLPEELAERLKGETEEEITQDAKILARYVKPQRTAPIFQQSDNKEDPVKKAYRFMAEALGEK